MSHPLGKLTACTGQAGIQLRTTHPGHGSKPTASPGASRSASINSAARNAIHGPYAGIDQHADDARSAQARELSQFHEVQHRAVLDKRVGHGASQAQRADGRDDVTFDHLAGVIVHRMLAVEPSRMLCGMLLEREPEVAAAVADHDYRARVRGGFAQLRFGAEGERIARDGNRGDQVESAPIAGDADELERIGHRSCNASAKVSGIRFFASPQNDVGGALLPGSKRDPRNVILSESEESHSTNIRTRESRCVPLNLSCTSRARRRSGRPARRALRR